MAFAGWTTKGPLMLLDVLDAAPNLAALQPLQAARLHALKGARQGQWAMTVNARWHVTFRFDDGNAHDVAIEDYHTG